MEPSILAPSPPFQGRPAVSATGAQLYLTGIQVWEGLGVAASGVSLGLYLQPPSSSRGSVRALAPRVATLPSVGQDSLWFSPSDIRSGSLHTHPALPQSRCTLDPQSLCRPLGTWPWLAGTRGHRYCPRCAERWLHSSPVTGGDAEVRRGQATCQRSRGSGSRPECPGAPSVPRTPLATAAWQLSFWSQSLGGAVLWWGASPAQGAATY